MKFYRYDIHRVHHTNIYGMDYTYKTTIQLTEYKLVKETPKGYWITQEGFYTGFSKNHWVSKTGRKRHAYPTKEEAMVSFVIRTRRRRAILQNQLDMCREALKLVNTIDK